MGRATQGVKLIKLNEGDEIASITRAIAEEENGDNEDNEDIEGTNLIVMEEDFDVDDIEDEEEDEEEDENEDDDQEEDNDEEK